MFLLQKEYIVALPIAIIFSFIVLAVAHYDDWRNSATKGSADKARYPSYHEPLHLRKHHNPNSSPI
jgi:hypothetical protein